MFHFHVSRIWRLEPASSSNARLLAMHVGYAGTTRYEYTIQECIAWAKMSAWDRMICRLSNYKCQIAGQMLAHHNCSGLIIRVIPVEDWLSMLIGVHVSGCYSESACRSTCYCCLSLIIGSYGSGKNIWSRGHNWMLGIVDHAPWTVPIGTPPHQIQHGRVALSENHS